MNTHLPLRNIPRAALYSKQRGIRERQEKEKIPMNLKSNSFLPSRYPNSTLDSTLAYVSLRTESVHRLFATTTTLGLTTGSNLNIYTIRKLRLASWRFNSWRTLTSTRSLESGLLSRRNRIGTNRRGGEASVRCIASRSRFVEGTKGDFEAGLGEFLFQPTRRCYKFIYRE